MRFLPAALVVLFLLPTVSAVADEIPPPFGFRWNDPASRVEKVLKGAKAKIGSRDHQRCAGNLDGGGIDPSGLEADAFYLQGRRC